MDYERERARGDQLVTTQDMLIAAQVKMEAELKAALGELLQVVTMRSRRRWWQWRKVG
jgi:hypothetical protein